MNRRHFLMLPGVALLARTVFGQIQQAPQAQQGGGASPADAEPVLPDKILLKDYRPKSVFKIPKTEIIKAKFPVIDIHHHGRGDAQSVAEMVRVMDTAGVESVVAFCGTGAALDASIQLYSKFPGRFHVWCGLNMAGHDQPDFGPATLKELERCHQVGAVGVGEISDKGAGIGGDLGGPPNLQGTPGGGGGGKGTGAPPRPATMGPHPDDPRMDAIWEKCADLGMPINLHVSDPYWAYLPQDKYNDGLMNAFRWRLDNKPGILGHDGLIESLERTVKKHPRTVFVACHLANLNYDLTRLALMFDRNPNLYADISARFDELAAIPRFTAQFLQKYGHRVTYGTDMTSYTQSNLSSTFRIVESLDEHFYNTYSHFWPLHGIGLPDDVLKKVYHDTAVNAFKQARDNARV